MSKYKYKSDEFTKNEFAKFFEWSKNNQDITDPDKAVDKYLEDSDIAVWNMRVLHGANTRDAMKELLLTISAAAAGILIVAALVYYNII